MENQNITRRCYNCGKEMPYKSTNCPYCSFVTKRGLIIFMIPFSIIVILTIIFGFFVEISDASLSNGIKVAIVIALTVFLVFESLRIFKKAQNQPTLLRQILSLLILIVAILYFLYLIIDMINSY